MQESRRIELRIAIWRARVAGWRFDLRLLKRDLLRAKANFDPSQPRVPRGESDGGRWTSIGGGTAAPRARPDAGTRLAQSTGGGSRPVLPYRMVWTPRGRFPATLQQETIYEMSRMNAEAAVRYIRDFNPRWQPRVQSLHGSIDGEIAQQNAILREAREYLDGIVRPLPGSAPGLSPLTPGIGHNGGPPLVDPRAPARSPLDVLAPGGRLIGYRFGRSGERIQTLPRTEFDANLLAMTRNRVFRIPTNGYPGVYYDFPDRCVIGVRVSGRNGLTFELIEPLASPPLDENIKFHWEHR